MFIGILLLNIIFGRFFGIISPTLTFYITFPLGTYIWAFWYRLCHKLLTFSTFLGSKRASCSLGDSFKCIADTDAVSLLGNELRCLKLVLPHSHPSDSTVLKV